MGSSSQEKGRSKRPSRKRPDTGDTLGLLGNEDLSTLFASSIAAPAPTDDDESEGEEIYNSGELDLRSMADAYFREQEAAAADAVDGDAPALLAPAELMIPTAEPERTLRGLPIALVAVLGLFLIAGTVLATLMILDRGDSNTVAEPAAAVEKAEPAAPTPAPAAAPVVISAPDDEDAEMVFDEEPAVDERAKRDDDEARTERRERRAKRDDEDKSDETDEADDGESKSREEVLAELRASRAEQPAPAPAAAKPEPAPAPAAPACDEVACLVNPSDPCCDKVGGASKQPKAEEAAASNLPEKLTSQDVNAGINRVRGRIGACGTKHGFQGVAKFKLTIAGDGSLSSASVDKGSDEFKSCVKDKLETAKFKETQKGLTVAYPFVFR